MGDGVQKKYALIINGDNESRHLGNVDQAVKALKAEGDYEFYVASTKKPSTSVQNYQSASSENLENLIEGLGSKIDDDDLLVVYTTGHGDLKGNEGACLGLPQECYSFASLNEQLEKLAYGRRIIVMDSCFSGAGLALFADKKTTVITQGSPGETVSCQLFSPHFWSTTVPDYDKNDIIDVRERYAYALEKGQTESLTQFFSPALPLSFSGKEDASPPFKPEVIEVNDGKALEKELKALRPGQLALVTFSADWCPPCQRYKPIFDGLAKVYNGRFLMIRAEGINGTENDWSQYGVDSFPTVAFIGSRGKVTVVDDRKNPMKTLQAHAINDPQVKKAKKERGFITYGLSTGLVTEHFRSIPKQLTTLEVVNYKNPHSVARFLSDNNNESDQLEAIRRADSIAGWGFQHIVTEQGQLLAIDKLEFQDEEKWLKYNRSTYKEHLLRNSKSEKVKEKVMDFLSSGFSEK